MWGKTFSSQEHLPHFTSRISLCNSCVSCCLLFQQPMLQASSFLHPNNRIGIYIYCQTENSAFKLKFREKTSEKRCHPSETDNLCAKGLPFLILTISSPGLQWVSKVCMQRRVLVITAFRQVNNLVNSIHKRALKFTYDDKGNKLNDIAPPNMKAYYHSLKSCFALPSFFLRFLKIQ